MSEFPSGWIQKPLKSLVSLNEKLRDIEDDEDCGFVPMNLVPTKLMGKIQHEQKKWGDCKKGYTHFKDGDVLLAKITPCFENGKSVLVSGLPNGIGAGSTEYFVLRSELLDSRYLHAFAKTKQFKDDCTVRMTGSVGHKRVPKDYLLEYPIPVAPLNEQIRIADKLDSVLAKVDVAQTRLEKIPTLLKRFRQSVLAAATSGELTREWRDENGVSFENWTSKTISEITTKCFDGPFGSKLKTADYTTEGVRVARLENIGHLKFLHEKETFISEEKFESLIGNKLADMDILFSSFVDEEVRTCIFRGELGTYINKADCFCLRTDSSQCLPEFLVLRLACKSTFEKVKGQVHGATRPRINLKFLKSLKLKIPSVQEQNEIVRRVESLFTLADTVEKQYLETKKRIDRLTQSLLAKAFRGELVPQDPNDEPAAELLKRIQAERNAQPPVKNKRAKPA
jgi:type I restriction enzyme S subunit